MSPVTRFPYWSVSVTVTEMAEPADGVEDEATTVETLGLRAAALQVTEGVWVRVTRSVVSVAVKVTFWAFVSVTENEATPVQFDAF